MLTNNSSDSFFESGHVPEPHGEDINAFISQFEKLPPLQIYDTATLWNMQQSELVVHVGRVQEKYQQLENDHGILTWEYNESQGTLNNYSLAAKLSHKLGISDLEKLARRAVSEVSQYFNCDFGALFLFNPETGLLTLSHSTAELPGEERVHYETDGEHFLIKLFFGHSEPFVAEHIDGMNFVILDTGENVSARIPESWHGLLGERAMAFPLQTQQTGEAGESLVLGGLLIGGAREKIEAKDAEVAVLFADLLASSLHNAMLVQKLNEMTIVDPLTGLFNRRHLVSRLKAAITHSLRQKHPLSLIMLDIDHFKKVNDTYGHLAGDKVLKETAALLKKSVRVEVDFPARYGGEEFIAVLSDTCIETGAAVAERIRINLREYAFDLDDGQRLNATCSLGVAQYRDGESMEAFIDRADSALYKAKKGGRDRVMLAGAEG